jgi:hypothetical protein
LTASSKLQILRAQNVCNKRWVRIHFTWTMFITDKVSSQELLAAILEAHGGLDRWNLTEKIQVTCNFYGFALEFKGKWIFLQNISTIRCCGLDSSHTNHFDFVHINYFESAVLTLMFEFQDILVHANLLSLSILAESLLLLSLDLKGTPKIGGYSKPTTPPSNLLTEQYSKSAQTRV